MGAPVSCAVCGQATTAAVDRETYVPSRTLRFAPQGVGGAYEPFELTVSTLGWVCENCRAFAIDMQAEEA